MSLLRLTGVTKRYPGMAAPAVDDLSLSVAAGEIVGASKMEQLDQAVAALSIRLDEAERRELEELYEPHPVKD